MIKQATYQKLNQKIQWGILNRYNCILVHGLSRDSQLVCFGCYGSLDDEEPLACEGCGLPLCSEPCQQAQQHQPECLAFRSLGTEAGRNLSMNLLSDIPTLHDTIMILRCLSLRQAPDDEWFKLNQVSLILKKYRAKSNWYIYTLFCLLVTSIV